MPGAVVRPCPRALRWACRKGQSGRPGNYEIMETAAHELIIEKRLIGPDAIRRQIEVLNSRTPVLGARVVLAEFGTIIPQDNGS